MFTFRIEVYTDGLLISGSYDLPLYRRVSGALNSGMYRYITLHDATIAPLAQPKHAKHVAQMLVDWSSALLVATLEEPEPPADFRNDEVVPRDSQQMMFFTSTFALRANFYKRPDLDLSETLARMNEDFIPLSAVHIFPLGGGQPTMRDFACLNRSSIQAMYVMGDASMPVLKPGAAAPVSAAPPPPTVTDGNDDGADSEEPSVDETSASED